MPVESAHHSHTLMAYPSMASADDEEHLKAMQDEVVDIANAISRFEPVHLFARPDLVAQAKALVTSNVFVREACADQLWIRDSGPVYVHDNQTNDHVAVAFNFNYWGDKLPHTGDESLAKHIATQANQPSLAASIRLEGGGLEHDGEGTFLGTESCIINDNRNPMMTKADIEAELTAILGVSHFIWLPGIKGYDITDYHIDAFARFVRPGVVLLSKPAARAPAVAQKAFHEARVILSNSTDSRGRQLTVYEVEEPDVTLLGPADEANEVIGTYANYFLVNGGVMIPKFDQATDEQALQFFKEFFPDREVVQIPINILPRSGGGIHCATQQVPA